MTNSCYKLPAGNVHIAFSGGRTSAFMLHQILEANGDLPARVQVTFQNTGREMPETLDFVREVGERWGVAITWLEYRPGLTVLDRFTDAMRAHLASLPPLAGLEAWCRENASDDLFEIVSHNSACRDGEPFAALVLRRQYLPNQAARFCTIECKVRTAKRYLRSLGWKRWTNCVGIRADEPHRLNKPAPKDRWTVWHPLAAANVGRAEVTKFWSSMPFDLSLPNVGGNCWLGNCDGCFLKSEANIAAFAREFPDRSAWWEAMEAMGSFIADKPTVGRFSKRYGRAQLREYVERQSDWIFRTEGALCQKANGECTG